MARKVNPQQFDSDREYERAKKDAQKAARNRRDDRQRKRGSE